MKQQFGMMIDQSRCVGCRTCQVACKMENRVPDGVFRMKVYNQEGSMINDRPTMNNNTFALSWTPTPCMHCGSPKCIPACPVNAIIKRDDGIVYIDQDKCTGCEACIGACPYGVPDFMSAYKKADKCDFCRHRVDVGSNPICVESCPSRALSFGFVDNQYTPVAKKIKVAKAAQMNPGEGTNPSVYYKK